ncbi:N-6 DNA methylase [Micromonospora sp. WMMA1998]|uniref:Eco57I restriction-modification methylase domain-containing protein n=1 Tax=Micromonospora sp. WMMA1998 TaxID=3015167 RepID=UPI00248AE62C|nr:N-6 DNA methylase [Micromonospora sp. WMMA1998]WBC17243.1 N-6 DNA methylase [Micromonospora sp. WMMA1998]
MTFPDSIRERVETFLRNRDDYRSGRYREDEVRREFINPLFENLGWDVQNKRGYAEAYKDVVTELPTRLGEATGAPDYAFRVGTTIKFLVEAKRPQVKIRESATSSFQLRRYAFSMGLSLSILTDFDEFAVYDTRDRPAESDSAAKSRLAYFTAEQYEENWEWLTATFSPQAVMLGSFDKYALDSSKRRGTSGVDRAFLTDIESWRSMLAVDMAPRNLSLTASELNDAVARLLDRVIFLRIAEDRGIEPYGELRRAVKRRRKTGVYRELFELFKRADDRYNSGLFHFRREARRAALPDTQSVSLEIDDEILRRLIDGLYYPDSPYEFSVLPPEILGRVYEKFLGKSIVISEGRRATVEEKPDVRLAGGVYYTPEYIIQYIAQRTINVWLSGKSYEDVNGRGSSSKPITIVDPACGSGSFLLGAYEVLLRWYRDQYLLEPERHARGRPARLYRGADGAWRLTLTERKRILTTHIFGVDKDYQAVETTKLSLLLKVLEGESDQIQSKQLELIQERVLPDLDANIRWGNSLIEPDIYLKYGADVAESIAEEVNPYSWRDEFPEIIQRGGFDVVLGNPPYVRVQRIPHIQADYLFSKYNTVVGKTDLSTVFIERALGLLHKDGKAGFISTSQWTATDYGRKVREHLGSGRLHEVVNFGSLPVFEDAETYPAIFIFGHQTKPSVLMREISHRTDLRLEAILSATETEVPLKRLGAKPWNLKPFDLFEHIEELKLDHSPLNSIGSFAVGDLTGMDDAFVLDEVQASKLMCDIILPYAGEGAGVSRFADTQIIKWVIYPYQEMADGRAALLEPSAMRNRYRPVYEHLMAFENDLRLRKDSRRLYAAGEDWYRHLRAGSFRLIRPRKLILKGIDTRCSAGWLRADSSFKGNNVPGMPLAGVSRRVELELLGILNSRLIGYHLRAVCPPKLGGFTRFTSTGVNALPLRLPSQVEKTSLDAPNQVSDFAEAMIETTAKLDACRSEREKVQVARRLEAIRSGLDEAVYRLYKVDDKSRRVIDEAMQ